MLIYIYATHMAVSIQTSPPLPKRNLTLSISTPNYIPFTYNALAAVSTPSCVVATDQSVFTPEALIYGLLWCNGILGLRA